MKTIKKLKNNMKTVAGSALLVGATLAGATAVTAQDNGSSGDLGDYPAPFVTEDGEVDTTVVVGETADDGEPVSTADVVSAVEIAGSLGNAAFEESETSVSVEGTSGTWSASDGVTLNRRNSDLFLSSATDAEITSLDEEDLGLLQETTFSSEDNNDVDVEYDVSVGEQNQNFNAGVGDVDDPVLHVENPQNPDDGSQSSDNGHLMSATVEFSETMDFTYTGDTGSIDGQADEYVDDGATIEMFGQDFEYSDESDAGELVFYGSSQNFEVGTDEEPETITIDGEDHEFSVGYVPSSESEDATVTVDGSTQSVSVGDTVNVDGTEVRITDFFKQAGDEGLGSVEFSIGSNELVINEGTEQDVELDGDTIDGVTVTTDTDSSDGFAETDGMTFYFGAEDSDEDYVEAGGMYEDPLFGLQFHYGGLTGDVVENPAEAIDVEAREDDVADITVNEGEDSVDFTFMDNEVNGQNTNPTALAADEDEDIATFEGQLLEEDDYVVLNANEEAGLYQITDLTNEVQDIDTNNNEGEVTVTLQNVVTGDSVTVEEDGIQDGDLSNTGGGNDAYYELTSESVEGKDFDVRFEETGEVSFTRSSGDSDVQVFPTLYTSSGAGMAFTEDQDEEGTSFATVNVDLSSSSTADLYERTIELPSTVSSSANTATLDVDDTDTNQITASIGGNSVTHDTSSSGSASEIEFTAGETVYQLTIDTASDTSQTGDTDPATVDVNHYLAVDGDQSDDGSTPSGGELNAAAFVVQPEDDEDEEFGYFFEPDVSDGAGSIDVTYTGPSGTNDGSISENSWMTASLDSQDNVEVGYNDYGAYTVYDTDADDSETFTYHLPAGQSTAGMAVTGSEGSLSSEGGSSGGSYTSMSPTYEFADAALDTDSNVGQAKQNQNLILVGGPSVNSLVQELVDDGQTMAASEYTEGEGMIQMVDGWSSGNSALVVAGHSGEDTRAAGEFLANYRDHASDLEGQDQVTISTETGSVVQ